MKGRGASNLLFVLLSFIILVIALEGVTRAYSAFFFPMLRVTDDELGWRHARNRQKYFTNEIGNRVLVVQNANGHRGTYYPKAKSTGKLRILILGDSFSEAVQVSENDLFSARLEARNNDWEVLNSGVGSYSTIQEYLYLKSEGIEFNPDVVALMFYNNDLLENCLPYSPGIGPRPYALVHADKVLLIDQLDYDKFSKFSLPVPFWVKLNQHSYFYTFLNSRIYQPILSERMQQHFKADREALEGCDQFRIFYHFLTRMVEHAGNYDAAFVVFLIPPVAEVAKSHSAVHDRILDHCKREQLHCVSLLSALHTAHVSGAKPYFDRDIHWNEIGHAVAATEIEKALNELTDSTALD